MQKINGKLKALYTTLNELYDKKIKGAQIRSKAKWIESGEKKPQNISLILKNKIKHLI